MALKFRIIKSNTCKKCIFYIPQLQQQGYQFDIYDGDAPENQKQLDEWRITEFPIVQIVDENNNLIEQCYPGPIAGRLILAKIKHLESQRLKH